MNKRDTLIKILVLLALIGFALCSLYTFYTAFELLDEGGKLPTDYKKELNPALKYITSGLTGLVGGIVATSLGVESLQRDLSKSVKFQKLGGLISRTQDKVSKEKLGFYYALTYIIVGCCSIAIWIYLHESAIESISHMATTSFGMFIPIVASYFNPST